MLNHPIYAKERFEFPKIASLPELCGVAEADRELAHGDGGRGGVLHLEGEQLDEGAVDAVGVQQGHVLAGAGQALRVRLALQPATLKKECGKMLRSLRRMR